MDEQNLGPRDFFAKEDAIADLGLIACPGALGQGGRHGWGYLYHPVGLPPLPVR